MVEEAAARARDAPLRWVVSTVEDAPERSAGERFELLLCHNVLPYVDDPQRACAGLASLLADGGRLSTTVCNRLAEPLRQAFLLRDLDTALAFAGGADSRRGATLGEDLALHLPEEAAGWLEACRLRLETAAGLLLVNHYLGAADGTNNTPDGYDAILRLELALCEREPYRRVAPFLHLIGRRR